MVSAVFLQSPVDFPRAQVLRKAAAAVADDGLLIIATHGSRPPWSWADPDIEFPTAEEILADLHLDMPDWTHVSVGSSARQATGPNGQTAPVTDILVVLERKPAIGLRLFRLNRAPGRNGGPTADNGGMAALLQVDDLTRVFDVSPPWLNRVTEGKPRRFLKAVDGVTFDVPKGTTLSLVGESGCGKSTIARCVVGLYPPTSGTIAFDGADLRTLRTRAQLAPVRRRVQMIFQDPFASLNPRWRVRRHHRRAPARLRPRRRQRRHRRPRWRAPRAGRPVPPPMAPSTPTSSLAASASASPSPAPWRRSPSSWSATNPPRRWTSPSKRKSST